MIITITRLINFGLLIISPVILVRVLSVEQFGAYREFLVFAALLTPIVQFGINSTLLYLIPSHPHSTWRFVRQSTILMALNSVFVLAVVAGIDGLTGGALVGANLVPLIAYILFSLNIDFWEFLWIARKRPKAVLGYTTSRLVARIAVVVTAAWLSASVQTIIWLLVALEAVRFLVSAIAWRMLDKGTEEPLSDSWRRQLSSCFPLGIALVIVTLTRNLGSVFVAKAMGPVALAHYTVGTYIAPIVTTLRNSLSDALLPEMADSQTFSRERALLLWQRTTVVFAILLLPLVVLLARFAEPIVLILFSAEYAPAIPVFQIYLLLLVRECFDFGVLVRVFDQNRLLIGANILAFAINLTLLALLMPLLGLRGAVLALLIGRFSDGLFLAWRMAKYCKTAIRQLIPWGSILKVSAAATIAGLLLLVLPLNVPGGAIGSVLLMGAASSVYVLAFVLLLRLFNVPEATILFQYARTLVMSRIKSR